MKKYNFATKAIHIGEEPDLEGSGDVVSPIHLSTTFARKKLGVPTGGYEYTRSLNPTRKALEEKLASLENAKYGLVFSSGLAAETTVVLSLLKSGDHIVAFDDLYGGSKRLFNKVFADFQIKTSYIDATDLSKVKEAILPETRLIWIETPSNPLLKVCDIRAIAKLAKSKGVLLVVDNTFLSPYFQNPLDLGADVVVHSSTKYIGGHSDVLGGSVLVNKEELYKKIAFYQNSAGAVLSPFDSYMTMRGIKTLAVRMEQHQKNAMALAQYLASHRKVCRVIYPGLESHPQYEISRGQTSGFGGVLSFEVKGDLADATRFMESLTIFALAESLGGVESLIGLPAVMTHASIDRSLRFELGITDTLIRVSVGIENIEDLIADFEKAFENVPD